MENALLLTDEEMDEAYCLADLHRDRMGHKAIAQAQLKKIVKFIGGVFSEAKWEALKKEIEDE